MAQVFGSDAVASVQAVTLTNGQNIGVITGNFLDPPFGTCKVNVRAACVLTLGSVPTTVNVKIFRNPNGENVQVAGSGALTFTTAGAGVEVFLGGTDAVPDGRPVQYQLVILCAGTGTNGASVQEYIEATLLSG